MVLIIGDIWIRSTLNPLLKVSHVHFQGVKLLLLGQDNKGAEYSLLATAILVMDLEDEFWPFRKYFLVKSSLLLLSKREVIVLVCVTQCEQFSDDLVYYAVLDISEINIFPQYTV